MRRRVHPSWTIAQRLAFWSKADPCGGRLWRGTKTKKGYGLLRVDGKNRQAHRLAWVGAHGPTNLHVLHKCDTPACINVDHLFVGTHADNMADRQSKGRSVGPQGEKAGAAKITESDVLKIREDQRSSSIVASEYGLSPSGVRAIRSRRSWAHVL